MYISVGGVWRGLVKSLREGGPLTHKQGMRVEGSIKSLRERGPLSHKQGGMRAKGVTQISAQRGSFVPQTRRCARGGGKSNPCTEGVLCPINKGVSSTVKSQRGSFVAQTKACTEGVLDSQTRGAHMEGVSQIPVQMGSFVPQTRECTRRGG
jgi:hypothetical protein